MLVYIAICSLIGSISVMAVKGFSVAVKLTFSGENQFQHLSTWIFGFTVLICAMTQVNYFNKALDLFSTNRVTPSKWSFSFLIAFSLLCLFYVGNHNCIRYFKSRCEKINSSKNFFYLFTIRLKWLLFWLDF
jgi:hypothetical protein